MKSIKSSKLHQRFSDDGSTSLRWNVDAKRLRSNVKVVVSPRLDVQLHGTIVPFKLILSPIRIGTGKGAGSFKASSGIGKIQLKCEDELAGSEFILSVTLSLPGATSSPKRSLLHDFKQNGV